MDNKNTFGRRLRRLFFELLLLFLLLGGIYLYRSTFGEIRFLEKLIGKDAGVNEDIDPDTSILMGEYTNIALFGLDNRSSGDFESGRSDTIMIASICNETGKIRLVSVYRDTYLKKDDSSYGKANGAFSAGGAAEAVAMLNRNLDLDITEYVCVDWNAMVEAIDALGGLDIEITEEERDQINKYKGDVDEVTGLDTPKVTEYGLVHLDGTQAVTYARIRKTAGNDYLRTSRQRIVLQKMLEKAKDADIRVLYKICREVFDDISTTLTIGQIAALLKETGNYEVEKTTGFPFELTTKIVKKADCVVPIDLAANVSRLHAFLFEEEDYVPSETVQSISKSIEKKTGVTADTKGVDTTKYNDTTGARGTESITEP